MSYELKKFTVTIINGYCEQIELLWVHVCYPEKQQLVVLCSNEQTDSAISPLVISGHIEYEPVIKYHLKGSCLLTGIYDDIAVLLTQHGCNFTYHDIEYYNII